MAILEGEVVALIARLTAKLTTYRAKNAVRESYYEGTQRLQDLHISLPPSLTSMRSVVAWPAMVVDSINQRINLEGFTADEEVAEQIKRIFQSNHLDSQSMLGHLDALLYGVAYILVGSGDPAEDEPEALVTVESPNAMTGDYDLKTRKMKSALHIAFDAKGNPETGTLFLKNETITFRYMVSSFLLPGTNPTPLFDEQTRDVHNFNAVPVNILINKPRASRLTGRSEITRTIMEATNAGMRTYVGAEVAREFYSAPQRYLMGANLEDFKTKDGMRKDPITAYLGRYMIVGKDREGGVPTAGTFDAASPEPFIKMVEMYATTIATEAQLPLSWFGFNSVNPPSADAIRATEAGLVKKVEDREKQWDKPWADSMKIALKILNPSLKISDLYNIRPIWRDPATPTLSATADATTKLIAEGVMMPNSEVAYSRLGFSESEKEILRKEKRDADRQGLLANIKTIATNINASNSVAAQLASQGNEE